jgi:hypothetical protein
MNNFYVYEHWRTDKDLCFYVGKGRGKRAYNMSNRNFYHKAIQKKLSISGFAIEIKIVKSGIEEQAAFDLERIRIEFWRGTGADLANFTNGGEGKSGAHSKDHRNKISKALLGKKKSSNVTASVIASNKRRIGSKHAPRSVEYKNKLSASLVGRVAPNKKPVLCVEDGTVYPSATDAAKAYNIKSVSSISEVCNGHRQSSAGKTFEYVGGE